MTAADQQFKAVKFGPVFVYALPGIETEYPHRVRITGTGIYKQWQAKCNQECLYALHTEYNELFRWANNHAWRHRITRTVKETA